MHLLPFCFWQADHGLYAVGDFAEGIDQLGEHFDRHVSCPRGLQEPMPREQADDRYVMVGDPEGRWVRCAGESWPTGRRKSASPCRSVTIPHEPLRFCAITRST